MHATDGRLRGRLPAHPGRASIPPVEELLFVVASHDDGTGSPRDVEHTERVGPARHQVTDEDELITARESDAVEQSFELDAAPVHVADDDGAHSPKCRPRSQPPHLLVIELGALRSDDQAVLGHEEPLSIGLEVESDLDP